ncbi:hypothetical protein ZWY2020_038012 [Hordeum vulgare]|nr:hypothetical protein ZWY2020_038012 [Hordeum vulgare]
MAFRNVAMRVLLLMVVVSAAYAKGKEEKKESADGPAASGPGGEYDITKLGAKPDGKTDSTKVLRILEGECGGGGMGFVRRHRQARSSSPRVISDWSSKFHGPCKAAASPSSWKATCLLPTTCQVPSNWIEIMRIKNLVITAKDRSTVKARPSGPRTVAKRTTTARSCQTPWCWTSVMTRSSKASLSSIPSSST